jgi:nucleotide-binding universal stress UspA family protein
MKKIIVATDFSETATNALMYATDMAVMLDSDILIVHVYQPSISFIEIALFRDREKDLQKIEKELEDLKYMLLKRVSRVIDIHYHISEGLFYPELSDICDQVQPYMVVLGSQGSSASERLLLGSNAVHAMKHLQWPILTVPKDARFNAVKKIGLACDLHDVASLIPAEKLNKLVLDLKAELHVLNIGKAGSYDPELVRGSEIMTEITANIKPEFHFLTGDDTEAGIIEFAGKLKVDLLIILPRKHGLIQRMVHRDHTSYFVLHSQVPVLALHQLELKTAPEKIQEAKG